MGRFFNSKVNAFQDVLNSKIYIDKTGLLEYTNSVIDTTSKFICNSRPRRFGKSITADMMTAYYSRSLDTEEMFEKLNFGQAANQKIQDEYINFLRGLFKGTEPSKYIHLAYLNGILPIKKIMTQSSLNNFSEFTMLDAKVFAKYTGFTEEEVKTLCDQYHRDFAKVKRRYDGYLLENCQVYNPKAVVEVMTWNKYQSYWSRTGTYDAIVPLINMDFVGLKTAVITMLSGSSVEVDVSCFQNDMIKFSSKDDVLTYLIHLGYLGYDQNTQSAFIPNEELRQELTAATRRKRWDEMMAFQAASDQLLDAPLD